MRVSDVIGIAVQEQCCENDTQLALAQYASRYKLDKLKALHIATIAADKGMLNSKEYREAKLKWEHALLMEIMQAAVKEKAS